MSIYVYELKWGGPSICDEMGDGLWDNNHRIALHLPIFRKHYYEYKNINLNELIKLFYICYDNVGNNENNIKPMKFSYFGLNDIVFNDNVWQRCKKAKIFIKDIQKKN